MEIVSKRFPNIPNIDLKTILDVYTRAKQFHISIRSSRQIFLGDLIKFCTRINCITAKMNECSLRYSVTQLEIIYREAYDCFVAMIANIEEKKTLAFNIGNVLGLSNHRVSFYLDHYKPELLVKEECVVAGRVSLPITNLHKKSLKSSSTFARTDSAVRLLEQIASCVQQCEPVLLVGETGTGKTTTVQQLASMMNQKLIVLNLSQQSDSTDLLGGYKPIESQTLLIPLKYRFDDLFSETFSTHANAAFIDSVNKLYLKKNFRKLVTAFESAIKMAKQVINAQKSPKSSGKIRKLIDTRLEISWENFETDLNNIKNQISEFSKSAAFHFEFIEGSLAKAIKNGDWVLLDEINLCSPETLETIQGLLEDKLSGSITLFERGDTDPLERNPNFRLFGNMNPANDAGKRHLPKGLQLRFTELWVDSPDSRYNDLIMIINGYISDFLPAKPQGERICANVAKFYTETKQISQSGFLFDGADQRINISLRTLTRALTFANFAAPTYKLSRALFHGLHMTFMTNLDSKSYEKVFKLMLDYILSSEKRPLSFIKEVPHNPKFADELHKYTLVDCFWIENGNFAVNEFLERDFILTDSVKANLSNLARGVLSKKYPVLIQGPTSAGKTSMVQYLAKLTGHRFIRINNHEHTDLQEYIGGYMSNDQGKLIFQEVMIFNNL